MVLPLPKSFIITGVGKHIRKFIVLTAKFAVQRRYALESERGEIFVDRSNQERIHGAAVRVHMDLEGWVEVK